jgi:hypothetical protein
MGGDGRPVTTALPPREKVVVSRRRERSNTMIRKHFRIKRIVLGLAFAAIAAPVAQATPYGGEPMTHNDAATSYLSTEVSSYELGSGATHVLPGGMTRTEDSIVRSENSFGVPGPSAGGATGPHEVATVSASSGFDWRDAGIGASLAFATALVLGTAIVLGRRNRSRLAGA